MTRTEMAEIMIVLLSNYPYAKIDDAGKAIDSWMLVFGERDAVEVGKAVRYYMSTKKFFPTPADITEIINHAHILYDEPEPPVKQIEASTKSYLDEQVDYIMEHFQEGGDFGWEEDQCSKCRRYNVCHK